MARGTAVAARGHRRVCRRSGHCRIAHAAHRPRGDDDPDARVQARGVTFQWISNGMSAASNTMPVFFVRPLPELMRRIANFILFVRPRPRPRPMLEAAHAKGSM